jgi:hypothetical protein
MSLHSLMIHSVNIKTETQTKSVDGYGSAPVLSTVTSNVPARFSQLRPQVAAVYYGKYDVESMATVYFDSDQGLSDVTSWINYNGIDYEVIAIRNAGGMLGRLFEVDVLMKAS